VTLFDTNVLIYAFTPDSCWHGWARSELIKCLSGAGAAFNPIILAELCVGDKDPATVSTRLQGLGLVCLDISIEVSPLAAAAFSRYLDARRAGGSRVSAKIPLPDFFIGAQSQLMGIPLATADVARYQTYFPEIQLSHPG
jgi:predicted nucleic acid-binding protein